MAFVFLNRMDTITNQSFKKWDFINGKAIARILLNMNYFSEI